MKNVSTIKPGGMKSTMRTFGYVGLILFVLFAMLFINKSKQKTVAVVRAKEDIFVNNLITKDKVESYEMLKGEFESASVKYFLWDDVDSIIDKYSTVYTKKGLYLCEGDTAETKPIKNAWLQQVAQGELVVSLPYVKASNFGNILTPGDTLKVSISYTEADAANYGATIDKQEILYEKAKVIDLLNQSGNSIYDYYTDLLSLPLAEREELLRDESFLTNVSPTRILLTVEENNGFTDYAEKINKSGINFTYGLYPRQEGDIILDQFSDITRQITLAQTQAGITTNASTAGGE